MAAVNRSKLLQYCCHFSTKRYTTDVKLPEQHYNVVIAGGGMVGTAAACAIAKNKKLSAKSVLLLEGGGRHEFQPKNQNDIYSNRVVSLNPASRTFLENLEAWPFVKENRFAPVKQLQVWDAGCDAAITFEYPGFSEDVSYIIENDVILYALDKVVKNCPSVSVKYNSKVVDVRLCRQDNPATVISLDNGTSYTCDLLVGAEGVSSATRRAIGGQYLSWSYKQKGVVATLKLSEPTENVVAWQRFLPAGPIALLPLTNSLSSLVWTTTNEEADRLIKMSEEAFVDCVNDALWKPHSQSPLVRRVEDSLVKILSNLPIGTTGHQQLPPSISYLLPGSRASFPLGFGHATRYTTPGAVLIGDAAHRVHPLAGLGVNLGFGDIETLVAELANAVYAGEKLGSISSLSKYQRQQLLHNFPIMTTIDVIQKLYCTDAAPAVIARSVAMHVMNALSPLKRVLMSQASS